MDMTPGLTIIRVAVVGSVATSAVAASSTSAFAFAFTASVTVLIVFGSVRFGLCGLRRRCWNSGRSRSRSRNHRCCLGAFEAADLIVEVRDIPVFEVGQIRLMELTPAVSERSEKSGVNVFWVDSFGGIYDDELEEAIPLLNVIVERGAVLSFARDPLVFVIHVLERIACCMDAKDNLPHFMCVSEAFKARFGRTGYSVLEGFASECISPLPTEFYRFRGDRWWRWFGPVEDTHHGVCSEGPCNGLFPILKLVFIPGG